MGAEGSEVDYLYAPEGTELHWDGLKNAAPAPQQASLSGSSSPLVHPADRQGMMGSSAGPDASYGHPRPSAGQATRPPTPEELMAQANAMLQNQMEQHHAMLGAGASTGARNDAGGKVPAWLAKEMNDSDEVDL